ncbi:N-alpha-acetyltransferase 30 [Brachyhypopomus gauderio]|uniref:N-alpha-acetyltransferase 30 n=1 Tax=Brachyhypopomus gauderio TaxID=698409 RepID=UPI0040416590
MAEVPPGPSVLSASPVESVPLPADGCSLGGSDEAPDCGRGDFIAPGAEEQRRVTGPKGKIKAGQNNVHARTAQFHSTLKQLNGVGSHDEQRGRVPVQNHVQQHRHRARREPDHQKGDSGCSDGHTGNHVPQTKWGGSCPSLSPPNNGVDPAGSETGPGPLGSDSGNSRTAGHFLHADPNDVGPRAPRTHGGGSEDTAAVRAHGRPHTPVSEMGGLSLIGGSADRAISYVRYESELQMPDIIRLITKDLSEPYSIYTYRYFIHNWPQLCFLAMVEKTCVGAIVCKLDMHKKMFRRGYIAMLAVDSQFRRKGIGTSLVKKAVYAMIDGDCDEVVLETEITNKSALKLYENLGFVRDKRLFRYYLNGVDALRLKLWLR